MNQRLLVIGILTRVSFPPGSCVMRGALSVKSSTLVSLLPSGWTVVTSLRVLLVPSALIVVVVDVLVIIREGSPRVRMNEDDPSSLIMVW
jgi:hypothetical protein